MTRDDWLAGGQPWAMLDHVQGKVSDRKLRLFACAAWRTVRFDRWATPNDDLPIVEGVEAWADGGPKPTPERIHFVGTHRLFDPAETAARHFTAPDFVTDRPLRAALLREIVGDPFAPVTLPTEFSRCARCDGKGWVYQGAPADDDQYACSGCGRPAGLYGHYSERSKTMECPKDDCRACAGRGAVALCPWLTPDALSIARAAYDGRPRKQCGKCNGTGKEMTPVYDDGPSSSTAAGVVGYRPVMNSPCPSCHGREPESDGTLDPVRLSILADALEEAGCDSEAILTHLRGPGPHVRGCWATDLVLGLS